jgi:hypothetical protein
MTDEAVCRVLDETIHALTIFDLNELQRIEAQIATMVKFDPVYVPEPSSPVWKKRRLLEVVLHSCEANLNALHRLHERNARDQWPH